MKDFLGRIGELLPDQTGKCRVKGCQNTWSCSGEQAISGRNNHHSRMCQDCFEIYKTLEDKTMPCSSPECSGTWIWNRFQQLEAKVQGRSKTPRGFCSHCREQQQALGDLEVPCQIKSCKNTWTWRASSRFIDGEKPPRRLCSQCFEKVKTLQDKQIPCRVSECDKTWTWDCYAQLEHLASGQSLDCPPKKMCQDCFAKFNSLKEKEMPCSTEGCSHTWKWLRFDQLEYELAIAKGKKVTIPSRRCAECYEKFSHLHDRKRPCANHFCHNLVNYSRKKQFEDLAKLGHERPEEYCQECQKKLSELTMKERSCQVLGCHNYRQFPPEEQLEEMTRSQAGYGEVRCLECEKFLRENQSLDLICPECGNTFQWSAYEQLLVAKNVTQKPLMCSDCAKLKVGEVCPTESAKIVHHLLIKIPTDGKWKQDREIANLPPAINATLRQRAEEADCRIVLLGDEFFGKETHTWIPFFEEQIFDMMPYLTCCVINSGIINSHSERCLARLERDVEPFQATLILLSPIFADANYAINEATIKLLVDKVISLGKPVVLILPPTAIYSPQSDIAKIVTSRNIWTVVAGRCNIPTIDLQTCLSSVINKWVNSDTNTLNEAGLRGVANLIANEVSQYFPTLKKE